MWLVEIFILRIRVFDYINDSQSQKRSFKWKCVTPRSIHPPAGTFLRWELVR